MQRKYELAIANFTAAIAIDNTIAVSVHDDSCFHNGRNIYYVYGYVYVILHYTTVLFKLEEYFSCNF